MAAVARDSQALVIDTSPVPRAIWELKVSARGYTQVSWRNQVNRSKIGQSCQNWIDEGGSEVVEFSTPKSATGVGGLPVLLSAGGRLTGGITREAFRERGSNAVRGCQPICSTAARGSRKPQARASDCREPTPEASPPPPTKYQCPDREARGTFTVLGVGLRLDRPSLKVFGGAAPTVGWKNCKGPPVSAYSFEVKDLAPNLRRLRRGGAVFVSITPKWRNCPGYPQFLGSDGLQTCRQRTKLLVTVFRSK